MRPASKFAEQAFAGSGPCALARPPRGLLGTEWELVWMSGDSELDLGGRLLEWWRELSNSGRPRAPARRSGRVSSRRDPSEGQVSSWVFLFLRSPCLVEVQELLYWVLSAVRALAPPVYPAGYLRRVDHVGGPAVRVV
ncbi:hypothetical protein BHE74_00030345 [Ensete ventricosum]|nr:hypothetical protein BHE74_00030345 [Ensete ventricosum]